MRNTLPWQWRTWHTDNKTPSCGALTLGSGRLLARWIARKHPDPRHQISEHGDYHQHDRQQQVVPMGCLIQKNRVAQLVDRKPAGRNHEESSACTTQRLAMISKRETVMTGE